MEALVNLRTNNSLVVSLPGADAQLSAKVHDHAYLGRLASQAAALGRKAGFNDVDPAELLNTHKFKQAHAWLRLAEVKKLQACVERNVGELQALQEQRKGAGSSSKTSRSLLKRSESRRKRIRSLLADLHAWTQVQGLPEVEGDGIITAMPAAWDDASMGNLLKGEFPWRGGGAATPQQLALMVQAEKYRDATAEVGIMGKGGRHALRAAKAFAICWVVRNKGAEHFTPTLHQRCTSQLMRTKEERVLLSWERAQSVRYFQHMRDQLQQCAAAKAAAGSEDGTATFACVLQQRAEASLLMRAAAKFGEQQVECEKRFANMRTHHKV